jgi:hypothetical protein
MNLVIKVDLEVKELQNIVGKEAELQHDGMIVRTYWMLFLNLKGRPELIFLGIFIENFGNVQTEIWWWILRWRVFSLLPFFWVLLVMEGLSILFRTLLDLIWYFNERQTRPLFGDGPRKEALRFKPSSKGRCIMLPQLLEVIMIRAI